MHPNIATNNQGFNFQNTLVIHWKKPSWWRERHFFFPNETETFLINKKASLMSGYPYALTDAAKAALWLYVKLCSEKEGVPSMPTTIPWKTYYSAEKFAMLCS